MTRTWELQQWVNGVLRARERYYDENECIWRMCSILDKMNMVDIANKGEFTKTEFLGETFCKRYTLDWFVPRVKFVIIKRTKGDINKLTFRAKIRKFIKEFNGKI